MIYTLIIGLLIEKLFYLLSPQSFSFQLIVSEFIDMFVNLSNFMSWGRAFDSLFCPEVRVFVHNDCPRGGEGGFWIKDGLHICFQTQLFSFLDA